MLTLLEIMQTSESDFKKWSTDQLKKAQQILNDAFDPVLQKWIHADGSERDRLCQEKDDLENKNAVVTGIINAR